MPETLALTLSTEDGDMIVLEESPLFERNLFLSLKPALRHDKDIRLTTSEVAQLVSMLAIWLGRE